MRMNPYSTAYLESRSPSLVCVYLFLSCTLTVMQVALPADDLADGQWSITLLEDVIWVRHMEEAYGTICT